MRRAWERLREDTLLLQRRRHRRQHGEPLPHFVYLKIGEEKSSVLDDRTANRRAEFVLVVLALFHAIKEVARVELVIAEILEYRSMKRIRARFAADQHRGSTAAPILRRVVEGKHAKLTDRVD